MASKVLNRVGMVLDETGGAYTQLVCDVLISELFNTPVQAGGTDGVSYYWLVEEGTDFMLFEGTLSVNSTDIRVNVGTILQSKISGVSGTTKLTLAGNARLRSPTPQQLIDAFLRFDISQSLTRAQKLQAQANMLTNHKNYIVNGATMVSQENGTTAGTTDGYYPVDQFFYAKSHDGTISIAQVVSATPAGSPYRLRATVTGTDTSIGSGQYVFIQTALEGLRVADLLLGTSGAKTLTLRAGIKAPAGTYGVRFANQAGNRVWVSEITISAGEANTDVVKTITVPGDTSGTWLKDTGAGLRISFCLAVGSTYQGTAGAWGSSDIYSTSNQFNFLGTNGNVFELFDVGLYEGSVAPDFVVPSYDRELWECQRYWEGDVSATNWTHQVSASDTFRRARVWFKTCKRSVPTVTIAGASHTVTGNVPTVNDCTVILNPGDTTTGAYFTSWTANARL